MKTNYLCPLEEIKRTSSDENNLSSSDENVYHSLKTNVSRSYSESRLSAEIKVVIEREKTQRKNCYFSNFG